MPELPEVQTVVTTLRPKLLGRTIGKVILNRQDIVEPRDIGLPTLLTGRSFADVQRRGKRIVLTLDDGNCFYIHLGMTGRFTVLAPHQASATHETRLAMADLVLRNVEAKLAGREPPTAVV